MEKEEEEMTQESIRCFTLLFVFLGKSESLGKLEQQLEEMILVVFGFSL
jgi:hypothetical protein